MMSSFCFSSFLIILTLLIACSFASDEDSIPSAPDYPPLPTLPPPPPNDDPPLGAVTADCNRRACLECSKKCPDFTTLRSESATCLSLLKVARSKYLSDAIGDCKMSKCADELYQDLCNLPRFKVTGSGLDLETHPSEDDDNDSLSTSDLLKRLNQFSTEYQRRSNMYKEKTAELIEKGSSLDSSINSKVREIHARFIKALELRAELAKAWKKGRSAEYHVQKLEVRRLKLERLARKSFAYFWYQYQDSYEAAVNSSALTLRQFRDDLARELDIFLREAVMLKILQSDHMEQDKRAQYIITIKESARMRTNYFKTVTGTLRAQRAFLKEAQSELLTMLSSIRDKIQKHREIVPCGPLALSDVFTDAIKTKLIT